MLWQDKRTILTIKEQISQSHNIKLSLDVHRDVIDIVQITVLKMYSTNEIKHIS